VYPNIFARGSSDDGLDPLASASLVLLSAFSIFGAISNKGVEDWSNRSPASRHSAASNAIDFP